LELKNTVEKEAADEKKVDEEKQNKQTEKETANEGFQF